MHLERQDCRTLQRSLQLLRVSPSARRRIRQDRATRRGTGCACHRKKESDPKLARQARAPAVRSATAATFPRRVATSKFVTKDGPRPIVQAEPTAFPLARIPWLACHSRAISQGQPRYRADNHGHCHPTAELAVLLFSSMNTSP